MIYSVFNCASLTASVLSLYSQNFHFDPTSPLKKAVQVQVVYELDLDCAKADSNSLPDVSKMPQPNRVEDATHMTSVNFHPPCTLVVSVAPDLLKNCDQLLAP